MAPIDQAHINDNLFIGQLNQQNVTTLNRNNLYDLNINTTQINSASDYRDKQIIEKLDHRNGTRHNRSLDENTSNRNSTVSFLSQYFSFMSYFVGNLQVKLYFI